MGPGTRGASRIGCYILIVIGATGGLTSGQELSTDVLPSEEELLEALQLGDIDYDKYELLLDLHLRGIDSSDSYLLEEIPGLWEIGWGNPDSIDELALDQEAPYVRSLRSGERPFLSANFRRQQRLDDEMPWSQRVDLRLSPNRTWSAAVIGRRDLDGSDHIRSRSVTCAPRGSSIDQLTLGDFTERYGLGLAIGNRGRVLCEGKGTSREALLCPNTGRFNGIAGRGSLAGLPARALASFQRDTAHVLRTLAAQLELGQRLGGAAIIVTANRLADRNGRGAIEDYKTSLSFTRKSARGATRGELCFQEGKQAGFGAACLEGSYRTGKDRISYAVWWYDEQYLDLTGGGRAATLRRTTKLTEIDFDLATKRSGQKGMLVSSSTALDPRTRFDLALSAAALNGDSANGQLLGALVRRMSQRTTLRCDYLTGAKVRDGFETIGDVTSHRVRAELRWKSGAAAVRSYVGLTLRQNAPGTGAWFCSAEFRSKKSGKWAVWSNVGKIVRSRVAYWYLYLENQQVLQRSVSGILKLSRSYSRERSPHVVWTLSLGLKAAI